MSIRRLTISVPEGTAARIKRAAGRTPVSVWVADLVESHLEERRLDEAWARFYEDVAPRAADRERANALLGRLTRRSGKSHSRAA